MLDRQVAPVAKGREAYIRPIQPNVKEVSSGTVQAFSNAHTSVWISTCRRKVQHKKKPDLESLPSIIESVSWEHNGIPESAVWSLSALEQALYLSLPVWVQAALLCNLMPKIGLVGFHDTFPARLMSYLLLPYTLPPCIFFEFTYRLLLRLRHIPEKVFGLWQDMKQIMLFITKITVSSLKKNLADRFLPSFHLTPALEILSECDVPTKTAPMRRRSTLRIQLSSVASSSTSRSLSHPKSEALAFSFQLDLGLEVDSQPDARALPPCQQPLSLGFLPSSEGEEETTPNLTTCQVPAGEGGEGEGEGEGEAGGHKNRNQHPAAVQGYE
ncbi:hypothetical protein SKAU_G00103990 [Synaphobranchus kaupii]|uniref:Uncharacterized protein n=1 Tax=Synaphobranchus kaupii TaxID=118154 RepID=A0A9Q1G039_SYNKA|nr:hypothetical protein SKAU_G00103990 [Synaphobranchus kaupii]